MEIQSQNQNSKLTNGKEAQLGRMRIIKLSDGVHAAVEVPDEKGRSWVNIVHAEKLKKVLAELF